MMKSSNPNHLGENKSRTVIPGEQLEGSSVTPPSSLTAFLGPKMMDLGKPVTGPFKHGNFGYPAVSFRGSTSKRLPPKVRRIAVAILCFINL